MSKAAYFEFGVNASVGAKVVLTSESVPYTVGASDTLNFKFDYFISTFLQFPWIFFDWSVKMGSWYLQDDGTWSSSNQYNRVYADQYAKWTTIDITPVPSSAYSGTPIYVEFIFDGNASYDASSLAGFKALPTTSLSVGAKKKGLEAVGGANFIRWYELDAGTDTEVSPVVLRPNDYDGSTNPVVWRLVGTTQLVGSPINLLNSISLDNVTLAFLPNAAEPKDEIKEELPINSRNTNILDIELYHSDVDDSFYNTEIITNNYFTLLDGTPTETWLDDGVTQRLDKHLVDDYSLQYKTAIKRLNYSGLSDVIIDPLKSIIETMDSNKRYMVMALSHRHRDNAYDLELVEHKVSAFNEPTPSNGAFDNTEFSIAFDI